MTWLSVKDNYSFPNKRILENEREIFWLYLDHLEVNVSEGHGFDYHQRLWSVALRRAHDQCCSALISLEYN